MSEFSAGYSRNPLPVNLPMPLAGHVTRKERMATFMRDPLEATAVVLESGAKLYAIVAVDMLVVTEGLFAEVEGRLKEAGFDGLYLTASHTHSGIGAYYDAKGIGYFMGKFRKEWKDNLVDTLEATALEARADRKPVQDFRFGSATVPGITMNRRDVRAVGDDRVVTLEFIREGGDPLVIFSTSGHPVVVSCNRPEVASADYPGELRKKFEATGRRPLFLPGALGGVNILFPEMELDLDTHLDMVTRQLFDGLKKALEGGKTVAVPEIAYDMDRLSFDICFPPTAVKNAPASVALKGLVASTVGYFYSRKVSPPTVMAPATVLRIGSVVLAGMPADFGLMATLDLRDRIQGAYGLQSVVTSHTNGFAGYVHLPEEYDWHKSARKEFFLYENAMGWYGRDVGKRLNDSVMKLLEG